MEKAEFVLLGDIVESFQQGAIRSNSQLGEGNVKYLKMGDLDGNGYYDDSNLSCTEASIEEIKRFSLKEGDFLINVRNSRDIVGKTCVINKNIPQNTIYNHMLVRIGFKKDVSTIYINAWFNTKFFKKKLDGIKTGTTTIIALYQKDLYRLPIYLPSLQIQRRIAHVLSTLDRKISLNRSINAELERMAKEIYDYWFVQFEFPDANGRPYKSSGGAMVYNPVLKREVPQGWEVKTLKDIISSNRGISYNTQSISGGGVPMINLASFNTDGTYKHKGLKLYNGDYTEEKVVHPLDLVLCNTQQTALDEKKDIIGKCFLVPFLFQGDIVCSHHVNIIRTTNKLFKPYLAYLSNTKHFHKFASGCCSGTNIMGLNFDTLQQYKIEIPSRMILEKFYDFVLNIEMQKGILSQEIIQLEDQRDELLPLLMTGQVEV